MVGGNRNGAIFNIGNVLYTTSRPRQCETMALLVKHVSMFADAHSSHLVGGGENRKSVRVDKQFCLCNRIRNRMTVYLNNNKLTSTHPAHNRSLSLSLSPSIYIHTHRELSAYSMLNAHTSILYNFSI